MRLNTICALLGFVLLSERCGAHAAPRPKMAADKLIEQLNDRPEIWAIESNDVIIVSHLSGRRMPGLTGFLCIEGPRNLRLQGEAVGTTYLDIGSNEHRSWYWLKEGDDSPLYFEDHANAKKAIKGLFPIQTDEIIIVLTQRKFDSNKLYALEERKEWCRLVEELSYRDKPARFATLFKRDDQARPVATGYALEDKQSGAVIWRAAIAKTRVFEIEVNSIKVRVDCPSEVLFEFPSQELKVNLKIGDRKLNQKPSAKESDGYFALPNWKGLKKIELGK